MTAIEAHDDGETLTTRTRHASGATLMTTMLREIDANRMTMKRKHRASVANRMTMKKKHRADVEAATTMTEESRRIPCS
jgi:hypothetical protein